MNEIARVVKMEENNFMKMMRRIETKPFLYSFGQKARVLSNVIEDGQTPEYWSGAKVEIRERYHTPIFKNRVYVVKHLKNNRICEFKEEELDKRYRRKR